MKSYFRFLSRNKLYTFINLAGLVVSLMFIILMGDYTWRQYSIDSWHKNADRICLTGSGEDFFMWPQAAQEIKAMCPEVEQTCCVMSQNGRIKYGQREVKDGDKENGIIMLTDSTFFNFFDFELTKGDKRTVLDAPDKCVITERLAQRLFGEKDPIGESLQIVGKRSVFMNHEDPYDSTLVYTVSGAELDKLAKKETETTIYSEFDEQFQAVGIIALLLLILEAFILEVKNPLLKNVSLFHRKKVTTLIALLLVAGTAMAQSDRQLIRHGNKQFKAGNFADAEVSYRKAVEKNPRNPQAVYNLGLALMKQQKDSAAVQQFMDAGKMETNPLRRAQSYHNAGVICQGKKMYGEAIDVYKEALRNNPADDETRYNLAVCKRQQKQQQQNQQQQKQDQQKQEQKQEEKKQEQKQEQQKQQQEQQQQMSRENAEQMLNAAMQEEKQTQQRMKKAQQQPNRRKLEKNW